MLVMIMRAHERVYYEGVYERVKVLMDRGLECVGVGVSVGATDHMLLLFSQHSLTTRCFSQGTTQSLVLSRHTRCRRGVVV